MTLPSKISLQYQELLTQTPDPSPHTQLPLSLLPFFSPMGVWHWYPYLLHPFGTKSYRFHLLSFFQICSSFQVYPLLLCAPCLAFKQIQLSHVVASINPRRSGPETCQNVPCTVHSPVLISLLGFMVTGMTAPLPSSASDSCM